MSKKEDGDQTASSNYEEILSQDTQRRIIERLSEVAGSPVCEMCGGEHWNLNQTLVSPIMLRFDVAQKGFAPTTSRSHPSVMVHCRDCGNSKIFSLQVLDVDIFESEDGGLDGDES